MFFYLLVHHYHCHHNPYHCLNHRHFFKKRFRIFSNKLVGGYIKISCHAYQHHPLLSLEIFLLKIENNLEIFFLKDFLEIFSDILLKYCLIEIKQKVFL